MTIEEWSEQFNSNNPTDGQERWQVIQRRLITDTPSAQSWFLRCEKAIVMSQMSEEGVGMWCICFQSNNGNHYEILSPLSKLNEGDMVDLNTIEYQHLRKANEDILRVDGIPIKKIHFMNIINENPYRILGVFSNASPAEIVSNCDEMDAYLAIGQSVQFDLDLNNILPAVIRTEQTVHKAKSKINLPKDKLKYALFWFIKDSSSAHALNHLKKGDFDSANSVFEIEDSYAAYMNHAVVAMIRDDLETAISYTAKMIHDDEMRVDFVESICGGVFSITENELAHLYIDSLLEEINASELLGLFAENGTSEDDDDYLKEKAINEPVSRINSEIAKAKSVGRDDADANYAAGKVLMNSTKNDMAKVKSLLGVSDMKYQMLADDLANTILQCGINYYNNTDDDDDIDKAMALQRYACEIAIGMMCKDRCNQNLTILENKRVEKAISSDLSVVANKLEAFQNRVSSIDNANNLVVECIPHLNNIKVNLGNTNNLYLQISSAVANNALGMLVTVINNVQNALIPHSLSSLNTLREKINAANYVMNLIGNLDMTSSERSHYNTNKSSLNNIQSQVNSLISTITSRMLSSTSPNRGYNSGQSTSEGCYIATMCYGDYDHPHVLVLRDFRDSVLLKHTWGQSFVRFYYRNSPNWVEYLKDKRLINNFIRKILDKFIILYKHVKK